MKRIQESVSGIEENMATSSAVSNLERRLDVLQEQAAENQYNLVRNKLRMWKGCCFGRPCTEKTFRPYITIGNSNRHATKHFTQEEHLTQTFSIASAREKQQIENVTPPFKIPHCQTHFLRVD